MKRVLSLVLALALSLGLILMPEVHGAGGAAFVLSVDKSTIPSQGVVEVTMAVTLPEGKSDIYVVSNYIRFPKGTFTLESVTSRLDPDITVQFNVVPEYQNTYECVYVAFSSRGGDPIHMDGQELVSFRLKATPSAKGSIPIENHPVHPQILLIESGDKKDVITPSLTNTRVTISDGGDEPDPPKPTSYTVKVASTSNGTVRSSAASATEGTAITLTATPNSGYQLSSITVTTASGKSVSLSGSGNTRSFTMPAENVTVSAGFTAISTGGGGGGGGGGATSYPIKVGIPANGSLAANYSSATSGTKVTLTVKPDSGYLLDQLTVTRGNGNTVKLSGSGSTWTFTMPAAAVNVLASFKRNPAAGGTIKIQPSDNGAVNADRLTANTGETVTLTVLPAGGYKTGSVTVKDASGNPVSVTDAGNGRFTFVMPNGDVTVQAAFVQTGASASDSGVSRYLNSDDHSAYLKGYKDGTIGPNNSITRAETATILFRLLREKPSERGHFSDVSASSWYGEAVETLAGMGIIKGYLDGSFGPGRPISRAEFATMMTRFANANEGAVQFSDTATHWARKEISAAAAYGWVKGYTDGTFRPNNSITRAEAVTILNRMLSRSADRTYAASHAGDLVPFSDLTNPNSWYYYDMVEAANGHEYTRTGDTETWSELHVKG